ncbi:hypothetical protein C2I36_01725 [Rhodobacteraceae bacterium WD3A24]|nr:hypothetical protein C2I36_01725 [Rhodobacteraceae bacterium WD3A24]
MGGEARLDPRHCAAALVPQGSRRTHATEGAGMTRWWSRWRAAFAALVFMAGAAPACAGWLALYETGSGAAIGPVFARESGGHVAFATGGDAASGDGPRRFVIRMTLGTRGAITGQQGYAADSLGALGVTVRAVRQASDGGHVLVGDAQDPPGEAILSRIGVSRGWAMRLDPQGDLRWARRFDDMTTRGDPAGRHYALRDVAALPDGGALAVGTTHATLAPGATEVPDMDLWLLRLAADGDLLWQRSHGGPQIDGGMAIARMAGGGFIAAGMTSGRDAAATGGDLWLLRLDGEGRVLWQRAYGGPLGPAAQGVDAGWRVHPLADGGYVVAGSTRSFGRGGAAEGDVWILRLDAGGAVRWQYAYGGARLDTRPDLHTLSDGFLVSASTTSFIADQAESAREWDWEAWYMRLDSAGRIRWQRRLGGPGRDFGGAIAPAGGGWVISGVSDAFDDRRSHGWLVRLDEDGTLPELDAGAPIRLQPTQARRHATDTEARAIDLRGGPAHARMSPVRMEMVETGVTHRLVTGGDGAGADDDGAAGPVTLGPDDSGRNIALTPGQNLRIRLPANPTTGLSWSVAALEEAVLALSGRSYEPLPNPEGVLGRGGHTTFTFRPRAEGTTALQLDYARGSGPVEERFAITVTVAPGG